MTLIKFLRNSGAVFGLLAVLISSGVLNGIPSVQAAFSDTGTALHGESIEYVAAKGVVKGYGDGTFRPWNLVNRAELITMLVNSQLPPEEISEAQDCFRDVQGEWFAPYVCTAKAQGWVSGYPDGLFRPSQGVTMAEADLIALRAFDFKFSAPKDEPWYQPGVNFVHENDIFSKFAFLPSRTITREEVAFLLHRFFLIQNKERPLLTERISASPGCGKAPPQHAPSSSRINGVNRDYITAIPEDYDPDEPLQLIFAFHGRTNSNAEVRRYYGIERAAGEQAIIVYPAGLRSGSGYTWNIPGDFALFDQLVREFSENYCIDMDRIYAVGHSLGAYFTNSLACARGDVLRAIGSVGGGTSYSQNCTGPVAALIMHNPKDNLVPFAQGVRARDQLRSQNQCGSGLVPAQPSSLSCQPYQVCGDDAPLIWCEHHEDNAYWDGSYYPHTWPRSAGQQIWKFFQSLD